MTISHGYNDARIDRPRFQGLNESGLLVLRARNRDLALTQRQRLADFLEIEAPAPESLIGPLAVVPISPVQPGAPVGIADQLGRTLRETYRIQVPIFPWPAPPQRLRRISAAPYNDEADYDRLLAALANEL